MNKATRTKLATTVEQLLQIKGLITAHEDQVDGLKKIVTDICDANQDDFSDGVLKLEGVGVVKTALNKARLVMMDGSDIPPLKLMELMEKLEATFRKETLDIPRLKAHAENGNPVVLKALNKMGVTVKQDTRYDVKPV